MQGFMARSRTLNNMWKLCAGLALAASFASTPASARGFDVSVGVTGEVAPGVYGRVDISSGPRYPAVIIDRPVVISRPRHYIDPVYLHVPPGHARKWDKYCYRYDACGTPVYFVRSPEYVGFQRSYIPDRYIYRSEPRIIDRGGYYGGQEYRYERRYDDHGHKHKHRDNWDDDRRRGGRYDDEDRRGRGRGRDHD